MVRTLYFLPPVGRRKSCIRHGRSEIGEMSWPIAVIQREEHDGTRRYYIEEESVRIEGETGVKSMPREDFGIVADLICRQ